MKISRPKLLVRVLTALVLYHYPGVALASNVGFIPGDAFFVSRIGEESLLRRSVGMKQIEFSYAYLTANMEFGGYLGFDKIRVHDEQSKLRQSLQSAFAAYRHSRGRGGIDSQSIASLYLFVYNRSCNWTDYRIGLRYNENWMSPPSDALKQRGLRKPRGREEYGEYDPFVRRASAIALDWQYARRRRSLGAKIPSGVSWALTGPKISAPVEIDSGAIKCALLSYEDALDCFDRKEGSSFLQVEESSVKIVRFSEGRVHVKRWRPTSD